MFHYQYYLVATVIHTQSLRSQIVSTYTYSSKHRDAGRAKEVKLHRQRSECRVDCFWNAMAHARKPDFFFRRNGRVHLNLQGRQFSRLLAAELCASAVVMLDTPCSEVGWRVLATHSILQFPLHFPSRASPCAITFQLDSTKKIFRVPICARVSQVHHPYIRETAGPNLGTPTTSTKEFYVFSDFWGDYKHSN